MPDHIYPPTPPILNKQCSMEIINNLLARGWWKQLLITQKIQLKRIEMKKKLYR